MAYLPITPIIRFLKKIRVSSSGCWEWQAGKDKAGYGRFCIGKRQIYLHRFIYEYYHGQICPDLTIDHLCRNRSCVNPLHLEQVTKKENILRGIGITAQESQQTHCKREHPLSGDNLYIDKRGSRICKSCNRNRVIEWNKNHPNYMKEWRRKQIMKLESNTMRGNNLG